MKAFYLGIDVSKGYSDFVILDFKKVPVVKGFQLDDTFEGHSRLYEILKRFLVDHPKAVLYAGVESTGGYESNWYKLLLSFNDSLNIQAARLNPSGVAYNSKADLKRNKTDKISAQSVAEFLISHPEKVTYQVHDFLTGIRKQWGFIQILKKQCTQFRNQLQSLLYISNPELLNFCKNGMSDWVLRLLLTHPTAEKLKRARAKTLAKIPYVSVDRAKELISNAKKSVASSTEPAIAQLITDTVFQILNIETAIKKQVDLLETQGSDIQEVKLLQTFKGIGSFSAIGLYLEIGSISRFKSAKKLSAFWGLHPVYKGSGDVEGGYKMSKQGRKNPRKILFTVALSAIESNPVIAPLYQNLLQQGRAKMDAIGICMHKIVRIIYGILKNNQAFDPEIDKANRRRSLPDITSDPKPMKTRRFQSYDIKAPISRRQSKKRLERERSQGATKGTVRGITPPVPVGNILSKLLENLNGS